MSRELTEYFINQDKLMYPVRVVHQEPVFDEQVEEETIIFILNPRGLRQSSFKHLIKPGVCYIFVKDSSSPGDKVDENALRVLLRDHNVNKHLERIKGLNRNVLELYIQKNKKWDIFGLAMSYKQLFSLQGMGYCFVEYPIITEELLNLDNIFIQEVTRAGHPIELINKYLDFMENNHCTKLEATNRRNAFQRVFKFYKSDCDEYEFNVDEDEVSFLIEVIELEHFTKDPINQAMMVGALTAACSYFVHTGYSKAYCSLMSKLLDLSESIKDGDIKYKYIDNKSLLQLKLGDTFLYYHLVCRIPNQYVISLFDMYLVENDEALRNGYLIDIEYLNGYLKNKMEELQLMPEGFLWGFKRDQEIGAIAGTLGQLCLYKNALIDGDESAFDKAEEYFKRSIEYAYPAERVRDINYLMHCRLEKLINLASLNMETTEIEKIITELANLNRARYLRGEGYNPFDVMVSAEIVAAASILLSLDKAEELYRIMDIDWGKIEDLQQSQSHVYSVYLMVSYLFFADKAFINKTMNFNRVINNAMEFFKLMDDSHKPEGIIDLIAVKFMLGHSYYISQYGSGSQSEFMTLMVYGDKIEATPIIFGKKQEYIDFINECKSKKALPVQALKLIYTIPY